jgi:hypothetical protein
MKNLIVALGLVDWEAQFVSGLSHPMFGMQVQRRCVDGVDIRAAIQVSACHGVLVSDSTPRINQDLLADLAEKNIQLIAITTDVDYWQTRCKSERKICIFDNASSMLGSSMYSKYPFTNFITSSSLS